MRFGEEEEDGAPVMGGKFRRAGPFHIRSILAGEVHGALWLTGAGRIRDSLLAPRSADRLW